MSAQRAAAAEIWVRGALCGPPRGSQLELAAHLGPILTQIGANCTPEEPQFVPGSIPEVGDPKLGAAVKSGVSGWQNLYLEHIGSDRRIFSEKVDPKRSLTHHRGPSEVLSSKSSPGR